MQPSGMRTGGVDACRRENSAAHTAGGEVAVPPRLQHTRRDCHAGGHTGSGARLYTFGRFVGWHKGAGILSVPQQRLQAHLQQSGSRPSERYACVMCAECAVQYEPVQTGTKALGTEAGSAHSPQQASQVFPPASSLQSASHPFNQPPLSHQARTHRACGLPLLPHALIAAPLCRHPAAVDQYCAVGAWLP